MLPAAWEIMFSVEDNGTPVRGGMIWSYPEPRVIRRLIVLPIPLAPFPLAAASDSLSVSVLGNMMIDFPDLVTITLFAPS